MAFIETKIVGHSSALKKNLDFICKIAKSDKNVLILGETGTGKDLIARRLHELSSHRNKPFVAINCANIPEGLFETELFGHVRGAFTGAIKEKKGLFEAASGGTIFLDEIGDLSLHFQAKILRIIENKEIRRIGETTDRKISARFIFATNKNLYEEIGKGKFRKDLFYRINVASMIIPPLKERKEDIPLLIEYILKKKNRTEYLGKEISECAIKKLMAYEFPGNIRELENIVERACIISEGNIVTERDVKLDCAMSKLGRSTTMTPERLRRTLEKCKWNKTKAAMEIGKSRRQFYRLLEKFNMRDCIKKN